VLFVCVGQEVDGVSCGRCRADVVRLSLDQLWRLARRRLGAKVAAEGDVSCLDDAVFHQDAVVCGVLARWPEVCAVSCSGPKLCVFVVGQ